MQIFEQQKSLQVDSLHWLENNCFLEGPSMSLFSLAFFSLLLASCGEVAKPCNKHYLQQKAPAAERCFNGPDLRALLVSLYTSPIKDQKILN